MPKKSSKTKKAEKPYRKANIPKAIREQCWVVTNGKVFECKCYVKWCTNLINPFDFHVGHDVPESEGGTLDINNIKPICARCNLSMSDNYTIQEWNELSKPKEKKCFNNCFYTFEHLKRRPNSNIF